MKIKNLKPDYFLDITKEVCPITFVKVRLQIEKMSPNEILEVLLKGEEPMTSIPNSVRELGHTILSIDPDPPQGAIMNVKPSSQVYRVIIKKRAKKAK